MLEKISNAINRASAGYVSGVGGTKIDPYQSTTSQDELKSINKDEADREALRTKLAMGLGGGDNKAVSYQKK